MDNRTLTKASIINSLTNVIVQIEFKEMQLCLEAIDCIYEGLDNDTAYDKLILQYLDDTRRFITLINDTEDY